LEFADLLSGRRMVRHYAPEPLPREVVERIVATVRRAPSGGYSQGQRLLVVTQTETRREIARLLGEDDALAAGREPWLSSAPVHVVVCCREDDYHERYRRPDKLQDGAEIEWPVPFWFVDAGAALMLLLLAALDEGLGAGVAGIPVEAQRPFRELLRIPDDVAVVALVTMGRPRDDPAWSAVTSRRTQPRRPPAETIRWEAWDGGSASLEPGAAGARKSG
jgi:FMN reductase [NAD(P)H]